jgi:hypothetical protein
MELLHTLLTLVVFLGAIGMVAYMLRGKIGLPPSSDPEVGPVRRDTLRMPPWWSVLIWLAAFIGFVVLNLRGD